MRLSRLASRILINRLSIWFAALLVLLITGLGSITVAQAQQGLQPIPKLDKLVVDQADILSSAEEEALWQKLWTFEKTKGSQIAVITVPTTAPEDIFSYSQRAAETYKLGRQGVGDGVLIVVAANDRKVWIYVMRSLEGAIPDVVAKRVVDEYITPEFKQGHYAAGLDAGTTQIMKLIEGESLPPPKTQQQSSNEGVGFLDLLVMIGSLAIIGSGIASATSRWLVAPPAGGIAGLIAYSMTSATGWGWIAGIAVFIFILIFGGGSYQSSTRRSANNSNDVFWGGGFGGGSGGWGGGGGFGGGGGWGGSGGGGDAGGGGAGGSW